MNVDLVRITARVAQIQRDYSRFCQNPEFQNQAIDLLNRNIEALKEQHIGQGLPDIAAIEASWNQFKQDVTKVEALTEIQTRVASLTRILAPSPLPAEVSTDVASDDEEIQDTVDIDEQVQAERLEAQKGRLSHEKPNLFKVIESLARSMEVGAYGKVIKAACMEQDPSVVYKDAFLRFVLIEESLTLQIPYTQHQLEWDISEESFARLLELKQEIREIAPKERISMLQKISTKEEAIPLTENEKKLFDYLNEAAHLLDLTKDEELVYPKLLWEIADKTEKAAAAYERAFSYIKRHRHIPLDRADYLLGELDKLRSAQPDSFFEAVHQTLKYLEKLKDQTAAQNGVSHLLKILDEEIKAHPEIMASFSNNEALVKYAADKLDVLGERGLNPKYKSLYILAAFSLFERDKALALKLLDKLLGFIQAGDRLPFQLAQGLMIYAPDQVLGLISHLSRQNAIECLFHLAGVAKETLHEEEALGPLKSGMLQSQIFVRERLSDYLKNPIKQNAKQIKIKIRLFVRYIKSIFSRKSFEEIEFELLQVALSSHAVMFLIPELVRIGKRDFAIESSRKILEEIEKRSSADKLWKHLTYAFLKASGLKWEALDEVAFGTLQESEATDDLDQEFTALYLQFMYSQQDPSLYIGGAIELSSALDVLAVDLRNDSYRTFSLQVADLLNKILPKTLNLIDSVEDPAQRAAMLSWLVMGFSQIEEADQVIPAATRALNEILSRDFPEAEFSPKLEKLADRLITSVQIVHKKHGPISSRMNSLKGELVEILFKSIKSMQGVEDRIMGFNNILEQLEIEYRQDDPFYVEVSIRAIKQIQAEIAIWEFSEELIDRKAQMLENLLSLAEPLSLDLAASIHSQFEAIQQEAIDSRIVQSELDQFEQELDAVDPVRTIERCIELIEQEHGSEIRGRILIIYTGLISRVDEPKQEELRASMDAALVPSDRTSPEDNSA